jgi:outer membrane lipoprotein-sorting protein
MIRRSAALAAAVVFVIGGVHAAARQTVDDLVAKNLQAKGGAEKIRAIKSLKQVARVGMAGMEMSVTAYSKRPNLMRREMNMAGQTMVMAFDGTTAWQINPMMGSTSPVVATGPEAAMFKDEADFDGPLVDYKTKGHTIELVGTESSGGRRLHHLKVTTSTKRVVHVYLDAQTGLEAKVVSDIPASSAGAGGTIEQEFADFRDVSGLKFPFLVKTQSPTGPVTITVDSIEVNPTIDDAIFKLPKGH